MKTNVIDVLSGSLYDIISLILFILPSIIFSFILVLVGIIFANILGRATKHLLADLLRLDHVLDRSGLGHFLNDTKISISGFFAGIVRWSLIVAFFVAAADVLGLNILATFLAELALYVPTVLSVAIIVIISVIASDVLARLVSGAAKSVNMNGSIAGAITRYSVFVWGIIAALSQLNIDTSVFTIVITGAVFALSLAFGLAFGLGGKEAAANSLEKMKGHF